MPCVAYCAKSQLTSMPFSLVQCKVNIGGKYPAKALSMREIGATLFLFLPSRLFVLAAVNPVYYGDVL